MAKVHCRSGNLGDISGSSFQLSYHSISLDKGCRSVLFCYKRRIAHHNSCIGILHQCQSRKCRGIYMGGTLLFHFFHRSCQDRCSTLQLKSQRILAIRPVSIYVPRHSMHIHSGRRSGNLSCWAHCKSDMLGNKDHIYNNLNFHNIEWDKKCMYDFVPNITQSPYIWCNCTQFLHCTSYILLNNFCMSHSHCHHIG